jgi:hypothetical protein
VLARSGGGGGCWLGRGSKWRPPPKGLPRTLDAEVARQNTVHRSLEALGSGGSKQGRGVGTPDWMGAARHDRTGTCSARQGLV